MDNETKSVLGSILSEIYELKNQIAKAQKQEPCMMILEFVL